MLSAAHSRSVSAILPSFSLANKPGFGSGGRAASFSTQSLDRSPPLLLLSVDVLSPSCTGWGQGHGFILFYEQQEEASGGGLRSDEALKSTLGPPFCPFWESVSELYVGREEGWEVGGG